LLEFHILVKDFIGILGVVPKTLALAVTIFILSTILGAIFALIEQYKIPVLTQIVKVFKLFLKGTPMVIFIFLTYFAFPAVVGFFTSIAGIAFDTNTISPVVMIIVALTLTLSSFQSEIVRGSFLAVEYGQVEAAYALGYTFFQSLWRVIVPQAFVEAIPDFTNSFMVILKALSLAFLITVIDIFAKAKLMAALDYHYLEAFFTAAIMYWAISYVLTIISNKYEGRLRSRSLRT
jgi:L-cystine transport system permease protein